MLRLHCYSYALIPFFVLGEPGLIHAAADIDFFAFTHGKFIFQYLYVIILICL